MATGGIDLKDLYLIKKSLKHHFTDICTVVRAKNIIDELFHFGFLDHEERDSLIMRIESLKPTGQAQVLFQFLLEPKNDNKLPGLMEVLQRKHRDIYETLCDTMRQISRGEIHIEESTRTYQESVIQHYTQLFGSHLKDFATAVINWSTGNRDRTSHEDHEMLEPASYSKSQSNESEEALLHTTTAIDIEETSNSVHNVETRMGNLQQELQELKRKYHFSLRNKNKIKKMLSVFFLAIVLIIMIHNATIYNEIPNKSVPHIFTRENNNGSGQA